MPKVIQPEEQLRLPFEERPEDGVIFSSYELEHDYDSGMYNLTEVATWLGRGSLTTQVNPPPEEGFTTTTTTSEPVRSTPPHDPKPRTKATHHKGGRSHNWSYSLQGRYDEMVPPELR